MSTVTNLPPIATIDLNSPQNTKLGEGGGGVVIRSRDPLTGSPIALKVMRHKGAARAELNALKDLSKRVPHIIRLRRAYKALDLSDGTEKRCLEMDLIRASNIHAAHLRRGSPKLEMEEIRSIAFQLFEFLDGLKKAGYLHADLKPFNIHWERKCRKLTVIDLSSAYKFGGSNENRTGTTFGYAPPELILGKECTSSYDLWSVGCVLYELITGHPFCRYSLELNDEEDTYLYVFQQVVSQIGPPSPTYLEKCNSANDVFSSERKLICTWDIPARPKWRNVIRFDLTERNIPAPEIDHWIVLLGRLLSYEDRGTASEHLENPLFRSEVTLHLVYNAAEKCDLFIHRANLFQGSAEPKIEDIPKMDVSIHLKSHWHGHLHLPREPDHQYFVFLNNGRRQVGGTVNLKGVTHLDISTMQTALNEDTVAEEPAVKKGKTEDISLEF